MGGGLEELAEEPEPEPVKAVAPAAPKENTLGEFVADLEDALGEDFLAAEPAKPAAPAKSAPAPSRVSVGAAPARPAAQVPVPPVAAAAAASASPSASTFSHQQHADMASLLAPGIAGSASPGSDLSQMFDELKGELEEDTVSTAADADPETHYNLGVAFREMGLLDEAIGELQKVCQIVDRGQSFPHTMQAYTWLAQCFLDKGVPEAAIRWYQQALKVPTIDQETQTALHYELASAYESAQNRSEALSHFLQVYGTNIDYRDVAERIKALKS
jgi:tetratricopeptide (TPR) repeat protein